jgi:hypothetical protein
MANVTTYRDLKTAECREHSSTAVQPVQNGRSYCYVTCPFCGAEVKAYVWSLAGGGKRCPCGALHTTIVTYKKTETP